MASTLVGGDRLTQEGTANHMTLGICGTFKGQRALITCGHGNESKPYLQVLGTRVGKIVECRTNQSESQVGINAYGDFAICSITNSYWLSSNMIAPVLPITGIQSVLPEGAAIYKYGDKTGLSYGTVLRSLGTEMFSYTGLDQFTRYSARGLYETSVYRSGGYAIDNGDSGGPVYLKKNNQYILHGIVTAGTENHAIMYSTPISYAMDIGFSPKITK